MLKSGCFGIAPLNEGNLEPRNIEPLPLASNTTGSGVISGKKIYWRIPGTDQWNEFSQVNSDSVKIPANAEFKVTINFNQVNRNLLKDHNYKLLYEAEEFLKDLNADGIIKNKDNNEIVGIINSTSENDKNTVILDFFQGKEWLDNFSADSTLESEFTYTGRLDLSKFDGETTNKITLAGIEIPIDKLGDGYANFADIDLQKEIANNQKIIQENGKYYLEYILTVHAGRDGAKDVKVIDSITKGLDFLEETSGGSKYYNVNKSKSPLSDSGMPFETISNNDQAEHGKVYLTKDTKDNVQSGEPSTIDEEDVSGANLAWYIGDMAADEIRTLKYRVQIKDSYVGIRHNNAPISNSADIISKNIKRNNDSTNFTPLANVQASKTSTRAVLQDDGTYRISFEVRITANANNTYALTDMRYNDYVNRGSKYQQYVNVDESTIKIFNADETEYVRTDKDKSLHPSHYEMIQTNGVAGKHEFNVFIGDLAPGEIKIIKYDIIADEVSIEQMDLPNHNSAQVDNQGDLYGDTVKQPNEKYVHVNKLYDVSRFNWTQKYSGNRVENTLHFVMDNDSVYDGTTPKPAGVNLPKITDVSEFTIPAGSYKYQVMLNGRNNETKWDLTETRWTDTISPIAGTKYLELTGYACVELYDQIMVNSSSNMTNVGNLISRKWVKIDGSSFDFSASQIEATRPSTGAYLITYYAKVPDNVMGFTRIDGVRNNFNMTGNVYYGEGDNQTVYLNLNRTSSVTQNVIEPDGLNAIKHAWYYDPNDQSFAECPNKDYNGNGVLYWTIELTGSRIYQGYELKDYIEFNSNTVTHNNDAFVGIYKVKFNSLEDYENQDFIKEKYGTVNKFLEIVDQTGSNITSFNEPIGYYMNDAVHTNGVIECSSKNNNEFKYHFSEGYNLSDLEKIVLIVRTEPKVLPSDNQTLNYSNVLQFSYDSINWKFSNRAEQPIIGPNGSIKKSAGSVYKKEGNTFTRISGSDTIAQNVNYDWGTDFYSGWSNNGESSRYWNNSNLAKDGTYVSWILDINKLNKASGEYDIVDHLPSGVELCYVQMTNCYNNFRATGNNSKAWDAYYKNGPAYGNPITKGPMPSGGWNLNSYSLSPEKGWAFTYTREKNEWIDDGFTAHRTASPVINTSGGNVGTNDYRTASIFYVKTNADNTQEVRIHLPYVQQNNQAQFRVVCRLTEEGEREKMFGDIVLNNNVAMFDKNGIQVDYSSSEITITGGGVNKSLLTDGKFNSNDSSKLASTVFPYKIVINESKIDMVSEFDYIVLPLIDRMTGNMSVELSTLKIYSDDILIYYGGVYSNDPNENGNPWYTDDVTKIGKFVGDLRENVSQKIVVQPDRLAYDDNGAAVIGIDGSQMKEIAFSNLPDSTKIIIEYSVSVQLKDNRLKFDNQAFWEGFQNNKGGDSDDMDFEYQAEAIAGENGHGSLSIYKYDSKDIARPLEDAVFGLYRVEYQLASDGYVFIKNGEHYVSGDSVGLHLIAVFQEDVQSNGNKDTEIRVRRTPKTENGFTSYIIDEVQIIKNNGELEWMDITTALSYGYKLRHEFDLNEDGSFKLCNQGALAIGKTDSNGRLTYGFGDSDKGTPVKLDETGNYVETDSYPDDRIHFNKVYAIKELKAPAGFILDETTRYFVVPNDKPGYNGTLLNYFYHDEWPDGVTVVNENSQHKLNYELNLPNDSSAINVTKKFGGNVTGNDLVAGEYKFALYNNIDADGNPSGIPIVRKIVYTDDEVTDYKSLENKANYNFKSVEFSNLLPGNYYLFELDDNDDPVRNNTKATINGNLNTVTYSSAVDTNASNKIEISSNEGKNVKVDILNSKYAVKITKKFSDASGELLDQGLAGNYVFGIWEKDQAITTNPIKTLTISWKVFEKDANKTAVFEGLDPNKEYLIYELDKDNLPITDGTLADFGSNKKYVVNYDNHVNNSGLITDGNNTPEVTVINVATVKLPNSGGSGTRLYKISGLALMTGAIVISKYKRRKEERRNN